MTNIIEDPQQQLMVTIHCLVFNHEPYLRQCLDGFVMQKTDFKFDAIIHDDASIDGSATIIKEYAEKYPNIIKPIIETENQYSKHDGTLTRIMNEHIHGKYVAICEGDDYWTDPNKLQKQVDFLESHPDYTMCFHKVNIETDKDILAHQYDKLEEREYTSNEILEEWIVPTCSTLIRYDVCKSKPLDNRFVCGDIIWFLTAAKLGRLYCLPDIMGVYRRLSTGITMTILDKDNYVEKWISHYQAIEQHFPKAQKAAQDLACLKMTIMLRKYWNKDKKKTIKYFFKYCRQGKWHFIYKLLAWFKHLVIVGNKK